MSSIEEERDLLLAILSGCPRCAARLAITDESLGEPPGTIPRQMPGNAEVAQAWTEAEAERELERAVLEAARALIAALDRDRITDELSLLRERVEAIEEGVAAKARPSAAEQEAQRLRDVLDQIALVVAPPDQPAELMGVDDVYPLVKALATELERKIEAHAVTWASWKEQRTRAETAESERDRFRFIVDLVQGWREVKDDDLDEDDALDEIYEAIDDLGLSADESPFRTAPPSVIERNPASESVEAHEIECLTQIAAAVDITVDPHEPMGPVVDRIVDKITRRRASIEALPDKLSNEAFPQNALLPDDGRPLLHYAEVLELVAEVLDG